MKWKKWPRTELYFWSTLHLNGVLDIFQTSLLSTANTVAGCKGWLILQAKCFSLLQRAFSVWLSKFRKLNWLFWGFIDLLCAFHCVRTLWFLWDIYGVTWAQSIQFNSCCQLKPQWYIRSHLHCGGCARWGVQDASYPNSCCGYKFPNPETEFCPITVSGLFLGPDPDPSTSPLISVRHLNTPGMQSSPNYLNYGGLIK